MTLGQPVFDHSIPQKIRHIYLHFDKRILPQLPDVYGDDVQFRDPVNAVNGLVQLNEYFERTMENLLDCRFEFHHSLEMPDRGEAVLLWTMHYRHKKLAGGKPLELTGNSHLMYTDKVHYHRDYYDAGAMVYEHLPLIGSVIRGLKKRLGDK